MRNQVGRMMALVAVLAGSAAHAQLSTRIVADIPFEFVVGNRALPAGQYELTGAPFEGVVLIRAEDASAQMFTITNPVQAVSPQGDAKLVFNRYGDRYFLSQIWPPGSDTGVELRKCKAEREIAKNPAVRHTVEVAAWQR